MTLNLRTTETEVDRASFQMVNHDIILMFFHYSDPGKGTVEYRCENFRGKTLKNQLNSKMSFDEWVLRTIKERMAKVTL